MQTSCKIIINQVNMVLQDCQFSTLDICLKSISKPTSVTDRVRLFETSENIIYTTYCINVEFINNK